jgi:hypothetical protein
MPVLSHQRLTTEVRFRVEAGHIEDVMDCNWQKLFVDSEAPVYCGKVFMLGYGVRIAGKSGCDGW